jgi:drug/metabolite transporter (DMT)-like permease
MLTAKQAWGVVALTLMWGINWPMMKLSLQEITPLYFRAITMTCGAAWLFVFYWLRGVRMWPKGAEWRRVLVLMVPNMVGWHTLSIFGVQALASGRAAILGFTMPVWTVFVGALFFGQALNKRSLIAAIAVLATVALLLADEWRALSGSPLGVLVMLGAALSWAIGTLMMRRAELTLQVEALTVWMMVLTSCTLWVLAMSTEPFPSFVFSTPMWLSLVYGVLFNYGFAQIIWFSMARHLPPVTSAMSLMTVPLIGTASATLIVGEWPRWQDGVAVLCVMVAIAAVLMPSRAARQKHEGAAHR